MEDEQQIWELRRGDEILGTLATSDWVQEPYISCDLTPAPAYKNYVALFDSYNSRPPTLEWQSTESGLLIPLPGSHEKVSKWNEWHQGIQEQIRSLDLALVPISPNAHAGKVSRIVIEGTFVQLIAEFDDQEESESHSET